MDHVRRYFREGKEDAGGRGRFHKVVSLCERRDLSWEEIESWSTDLPKGWFELARLPREDRIEFLREYWQMTLPFEPHTNKRIDRFFSQLASVDLFLVQRTYDAPLRSHLVYALEEDHGFFHGSPPAPLEAIRSIKVWPEEVEPPRDYRAFLRIHDGFAKYTDTGLIPSSHLQDVYDRFQVFLRQRPPLLRANGEEISPDHLVPFYQSFGLDCFQVFYSHWYPEQEMGNLYYSGIDHVISDFTDRTVWAEQQAFPTFLDWLAFYLELIEGP